MGFFLVFYNHLIHQIIGFYVVNLLYLMYFLLMVK